MAVKTITIRKETYEKLLRFKRADESFSKLLERLVGERNSFDIIVKLKGSVDWKDKEKLVEEIYSKRFERR
ncbi:MAG: hypothetical protein J7J87_01960 [Candidatus Diapherotrites archaeon]|nr:hypothetical protein [Candidatus Diapherotrites archaeon]